MPQIREKELAPNQVKYFDIALNENVLIKNDESLLMANTVNNRVKKHKKPDTDFYRAITAEELLIGIHEDIDKFFANKTN